MSKFLAAGLMVAVAVAVLSIPMPSVSGSVQIRPGPEAGGTCGCPKNYRCCLDCNFNYICVRSIGQCPECPAP